MLAIAVTAVYWPGLSGSFLFDDYGQIVLNSALHLNALSPLELEKVASSSLSGPLGRPIAMISFSLEEYRYGIDPWHMKFDNVLIHAVNSILLFTLANKIYRVLSPKHSTSSTFNSWWPPFVLAALWALHPLQVSTVLYVIQRMTSLSALFSLAGLLAYFHFRTSCHMTRYQPYLALTVLALFTLLATLTKENGILTWIYAALLEWLVIKFKSTTSAQKRGLLLALVWFPAVVLAIGTILFAISPGRIINGYADRPFDIYERLMTEARAMFYYMRFILVPDIHAMSLYHDDYPISTSLVTPISTLPAILGNIALILAAFAFRESMPLFSLGIFVYYTGHSIESTIIPLELVFEHRNYLPMAGLIAAAFSLFAALAKRLTISKETLRNVAIVLIGLAMATTAARATDWGTPLMHQITEAERHPGSARANFDAGQAMQQFMQLYPQHRDEFAEKAIAYYTKSIQSDPNALVPLIGVFEVSALAHIKVSAVYYQELRSRFQHGIPPRAEDFVFRSLVRVLTDTPPILGDAEGESLFLAALSNPKLSDRSRATCDVAYGLYVSSRLGNKTRGITLLESAVDLVPGDINNRVMLAASLIDAQRYDEAKEELEQARHLDKYRHFENEINGLLKMSNK